MHQRLTEWNSFINKIELDALRKERPKMARVSIEDCLDVIENRFALVMIASHRTRQLLNGTEPLLRTKNKEAVTALREIAEGVVVARPRGSSAVSGEE
jgi:DNA-directed RNA polymerase subunit omega